MPSSDENVLSSLITYQGTNNDSFHFWTQSLTRFLDGKQFSKVNLRYINNSA